MDFFYIGTRTDDSTPVPRSTPASADTSTTTGVPNDNPTPEATDDPTLM